MKYNISSYSGKYAFLSLFKRSQFSRQTKMALAAPQHQISGDGKRHILHESIQNHSAKSFFQDLLAAQSSGVS